MRNFGLLLSALCLSTQLLQGVPADSRETARVLVEVPPLQDLNVEHFAIHVPTPTIYDRERGYIDLPEAIRLRVSSNTAWRLLIFSDEHGFRKGTAQDKPLSHFQWCLRGSRELHGLRREAQVIAESESYADNELYIIDCRVLLDWETDSPGEHQLSLRLELENLEGRR